MLSGIGRKAQEYWRAKRRRGSEAEPVDDIQRENLDDAESETTEMFRAGGLLGDIRGNWAKGLGETNVIQHTRPMSLNLLLLYEIKEKAAKVTSRKAFREFERWVTNLVSTYKDAAIERAANIQLFRLRDEFAGGLA